LVMNQYFADDLKNFNEDTESGFSDVKNGGNLANNGRGQDKWELYTLAYMMDHTDKGMQEELYKAMALANKLGVLKADEDGKSLLARVKQCS
jgi:hypothetical protein